MHMSDGRICRQACGEGVMPKTVVALPDAGFAGVAGGIGEFGRVAIGDFGQAGLVGARRVGDDGSHV